jgi:hypothetical protein
MWPHAPFPVAMWPRSLIHVVDFGHVDCRHAATWSRPLFTRGHMATCINPRGHVATCINPRGHMDMCINPRGHMDSCN